MKWFLYISGMFLTAIVGAIISTVFAEIALSHFIEAVIPLDPSLVKLTCAGAITAIFLVSYGFWFAPKAKIICVLFCFVFGAFLATVSGELSVYPEGHIYEYQPNRKPLFITYISGLVTVFFYVIYDLKKQNNWLWH